MMKTVYIFLVVILCSTAGLFASSPCSADGQQSEACSAEAGKPRSACDKDLCSTPIPEDENQCGIAGVWQNQLKSVMKFTCKDGLIEGKYCSEVGEAISFYPMTGRYLIVDDNMNVILGWTVAWKNTVLGNSNSATSWTGISFGGEAKINTQWLLLRTSPVLWNTTQINGDTFTKLCSD